MILRFPSLPYADSGLPLLRRLALVEAPAFSGWVGAALLGQPPGEAEDVLHPELP